MNDTLQIVSEMYKEEIAGQIEQKILNMSNVRILKLMIEEKDAEITKLNEEVIKLNNEINNLKNIYKTEVPVEFIEAEVVDPESNY